MRVPLLSLVILLIGLLTLPAPAGVKRAEDLFTGTWVVTGAMHKGQPVEKVKGNTYTFGEDGVTVTSAAGKTRKGLFKVDLTRKPPAIDLVFADGDKERMFGVFEFVGNVLRLNYARDAADRPSELQPEKDRNWTLLILSRVNR